MFCIACGKKLTSEAAYCPYCGQKVEKETTYSFKGDQLHTDKFTASDSNNGCDSSYSYKGNQIHQDGNRQAHSSRGDASSSAYSYTSANASQSSAHTTNQNYERVNTTQSKTAKSKIFATKKKRNIVFAVIAAIVVICIIVGIAESGKVENAIVGTWKGEFTRDGSSWTNHYTCTLTFREDNTFVFNMDCETTGSINDYTQGCEMEAGTYSIGEGIITLDCGWIYWVMDIDISGRTMKLTANRDDAHILGDRGDLEEINAVEWKKQ